MQDLRLVDWDIDSLGSYPEGNLAFGTNWELAKAKMQGMHLHLAEAIGLHLHLAEAIGLATYFLVPAKWEMLLA